MLQDSVGRLRVLVADPHCCVREGLKALLNAQPDMRVVGEAGDGPTALAVAAERDPDVVVLEASLPGLDGAQVVARMREECPDRRVLVLTARGHRGSMRLLLGMGARGCVLKRAPADQLVRAVRNVGGGGAYTDPEMAGELVGDFIGAERPDAERSARECDVVRRIALGYSNKEVAAKLGVSVKTVETYKARVMGKLRMRSRVDLVRFAVQSGWLDDIEQPVVVSGPSA